MSELTPGANTDIVAMRKAVMSANVAADVRDSCIHKLDTLVTLMADENDELMSGLMELSRIGDIARLENVLKCHPMFSS